MRRTAEEDKKAIKQALKGTISNRQDYDGWMLQVRQGKLRVLVESSFSRTREECRAKRRGTVDDLFTKLAAEPVKVRMQFVWVP